MLFVFLTKLGHLIQIFAVIVPSWLGWKWVCARARIILRNYDVEPDVRLTTMCLVLVKPEFDEFCKSLLCCCFLPAEEPYNLNLGKTLTETVKSVKCLCTSL